MCYTVGMDEAVLKRLFDFIPLLETEGMRNAHSVYIATGEYSPQVRDLQGCVKGSGLYPQDVDWRGWVEELRPFLQSPETIVSADATTVTKLVAMAANAEKLNQSFFPHLCSSGFMLMLLKRLRESVYQ
ncbi:MAG: hypothetical protein RIS36_1538 [Pseudomonadota bacterium]